MKKSRFTNKQIAFALRQAEAGTLVEEVCRCFQTFDFLLLLAINPTGNDYQEKLPRLKNEFHRRLGGSANPRRSVVAVGM